MTRRRPRSPLLNGMAVTFSLAALAKFLLPLSLRCELRQRLYYWRHLQWMDGKFRLSFPDRLFLEDEIFPWISQQDNLRRILFIGCDWYTQSYPQKFPGREFWTIEIDPTKARYGSPHHLVDGIENLCRHVEPGFFDAIVHTGVFGWGLDTREAVEASFAQCFRALRSGGWFVFGWDDIPEHCPFPVIEQSRVLPQFEPVTFPSVQAHRHLVADDDLRHTFAFYRKPGGAD